MSNDDPRIKQFAKVMVAAAPICHTCPFVAYWSFLELDCLEGIPRIGKRPNTAGLRWFGDRADCLPEVELGPGGPPDRDRDSSRRDPTPDCQLGFGFRLRLAIPRNDRSRTRHRRELCRR